VTWDDVTTDASDAPLVCHPSLAQFLQQFTSLVQAHGQTLPDAQLIVRHGLDQVKAFLQTPHASGWKTLAQATAYKPLQMLAEERTVTFSALQAALQSWRIGHVMPTLSHTAGGDWVYNAKASLTQDVITYVPVTRGEGNHQAQMVILGRLDDREAQVAGSDFRERWRCFLACMNLYQFCDRFIMWTTSEALGGLAPDLPTAVQPTLDEAWAHILEQITTAFRPYIPALSAAGAPVPQVEFYHDEIDDDAFAELAWPQLHPPVAVLAGDQVAFASQWQQLGWHVIAADDLHAKGVGWLIEVMTAGAVGR
jgi:DEAD/DEAH box helicase domain-containing protein